MSQEHRADGDTRESIGQSPSCVAAATFGDIEVVVMVTDGRERQPVKLKLELCGYTPPPNMSPFRQPIETTESAKLIDLNMYV